MNKLVTRINWVNDTDPAINDTHLNQMDSELDAIDDRVIAMEGDVEAQAEEAEAWAVGERGGEAVQSSDPTYHNNSKYYSQQASNSATNAGTSETNAGNSATAAGNSATAAGNSALVSEGWAKGTQNGTPVASGSPYYENNAKYWKDQAQQIASQTIGGLSDVTINAPTEGQVLTYDSANNIWHNSDGGSVETKSGNPLSLTTDSAQVARSTTIALNPIQASGTPTPANPIPIYGYDAVKVRGTGKNLLDKNSLTSNRAIGGSGAVVSGQGVTGITKFIKVKPNTTYTFSGLGNVSDAVGTHGAEYSTDGDYTSYVQSIGTSSVSNLTFTTSASTNYVVLTVLLSSASPQLELGSTATAYEPYTEATDISETLPATIYGGTLDVETGVLTVKYGMVDMGDLNYNYYSNDGGYFSCSITDKADSNNIISEIYKNNGIVAVGSMANNTLAGRTNSNVVYIKDNRYTDGGNLKTAVTGQKIVYELATPYTIQLTPHQVALLAGSNVITTNGTTINITYRTGKVATLADLEGMAKTINEVADIANGDKSASQITAGTFSGPVKANPTAMANLGTAQVRSIIVTDTAPTVGSSTTIPDGTLIIVYE